MADALGVQQAENKSKVQMGLAIPTRIIVNNFSQDKKKVLFEPNED